MYLRAMRCSRLDPRCLLLGSRSTLCPSAGSAGPTQTPRPICGLGVDGQGTLGLVLRGACRHHGMDTSEAALIRLKET